MKKLIIIFITLLCVTGFSQTKKKITQNKPKETKEQLQIKLEELKTEYQLVNEKIYSYRTQEYFLGENFNDSINYARNNSSAWYTLSKVNNYTKEQKIQFINVYKTNKVFVDKLLIDKISLNDKINILEDKIYSMPSTYTGWQTIYQNGRRKTVYMKNGVISNPPN